MTERGEVVFFFCINSNFYQVRFLPESYIPPKPVREQRELLRFWCMLVNFRVRFKNRVHDIIDKLGITHPYSDLFGSSGIAFLNSLSLPDLYQKELHQCLGNIEFFNQEIKEVEKDMDCCYSSHCAIDHIDLLQSSGHDSMEPFC